MTQIGFTFDEENRSKGPERKTREREEHEGPCELELESPPADHEISSVLRCRLSRDHRMRLEPGSRQQVMKELLGRDLLVGKAHEEALTWKNGGTPYGFITKGA